MAIKTLTPGMKVRNPKCKTPHVVYEVVSVNDKKRNYVDKNVVLTIVDSQWFTTWHLGTMLDEWEVVE